MMVGEGALHHRLSLSCTMWRQVKCRLWYPLLVRLSQYSASSGEPEVHWLSDSTSHSSLLSLLFASVYSVLRKGVYSCIHVCHVFDGQVAKKPDMQREKLLQDEEEEQQGIWDSISRWVLCVWACGCVCVCVHMCMHVCAPEQQNGKFILD